MRIIIVAILAGVLFFTGCKEESNPTSSSNDVNLIGNWILAKEKYTETVNGVVTSIDSIIYTTSESPALLIFAANTITGYYNDGYETTIENISYTTLNGKIFVQGSSVDYSVTGDLFKVYQSAVTDSSVQKLDLFYDKYTGNIPPDGWPPVPTKPIPDSVTVISTNGTSLNGALVDSAVDWYSFTATSGNAYTIKTTGILDTYLRLFEVTGTVLTMINSNDDGSNSDLNAKIIWSCSSDGTYYFNVRGFDDLQVGNYGVSVTSARSTFGQSIFLSQVRQGKNRKKMGLKNYKIK